MSPPADPSPVGNGKSIAALASGAISTILIYAGNAVLQHYGQPPLPGEITAAVQTLVMVGAVYFTPHGM